MLGKIGPSSGQGISDCARIGNESVPLATAERAASSVRSSRARGPFNLFPGIVHLGLDAGEQPHLRGHSGISARISPAPPNPITNPLYPQLYSFFLLLLLGGQSPHHRTKNTGLPGETLHCAVFTAAPAPSRAFTLLRYHIHRDSEGSFTDNLAQHFSQQFSSERRRAHRGGTSRLRSSPGLLHRRGSMDAVTQTRSKTEQRSGAPAESGKRAAQLARATWRHWRGAAGSPAREPRRGPPRAARPTPHPATRVPPDPSLPASSIQMPPPRLLSTLSIPALACIQLPGDTHRVHGSGALSLLCSALCALLACSDFISMARPG